MSPEALAAAPIYEPPSASVKVTREGSARVLDLFERARRRPSARWSAPRRRWRRRAHRLPGHHQGPAREHGDQVQARGRRLRARGRRERRLRGERGDQLRQAPRRAAGGGGGAESRGAGGRVPTRAFAPSTRTTARTPRRGGRSSTRREREPPRGTRTPRAFTAAGASRTRGRRMLSTRRSIRSAPRVISGVVAAREPQPRRPGRVRVIGIAVRDGGAGSPYGRDESGGIPAPPALLRGEEIPRSAYTRLRRRRPRVEAAVEVMERAPEKNLELQFQSARRDPERRLTRVRIRRFCSRDGDGGFGDRGRGGFGGGGGPPRPPRSRGDGGVGAWTGGSSTSRTRWLSPVRELGVSSDGAKEGVLSSGARWWREEGR